jgi:AraC-like DNA-binding protein
MDFTSEERASDSPLVEKVWRAQSERAGVFTSLAANRWEMVVSTFQGQTTLSVRGPETRATQAESPAEAEFFGIIFKPGVYMPLLPPQMLRNRNDVLLPGTAFNSFWLNGDTWQLPDYENSDAFVSRLANKELLAHDPVVDAALNDQPLDLSPRSVQRRFLRATGLTISTYLQIERATLAMSLLEQGLPILDVVDQAGYYDQPHLTRTLKQYMGQTPGEISAEP